MSHIKECVHIQQNFETLQEHVKGHWPCICIVQSVEQVLFDSADFRRLSKCIRSMRRSYPTSVLNHWRRPICYVQRSEGNILWIVCPNELMQVHVYEVSTLDDSCPVRPARQIVTPIRYEFISPTDEGTCEYKSPVGGVHLRVEGMLNVRTVLALECFEYMLDGMN